MRPVSRNSVHKGSSAKRFRKNVSKSASMNVRAAPMRGGWRL